jgi:hypothetical protein
MPIWRLTPIPSQRQDPAWLASPHTGVLVVRAADERHARAVAAGACSTALPLRGPWTQPSLVTCTRDEHAAYPAEGPDAVLWPEAFAG